MRKATRRFRDERGFTLIELMVVVLIIGILAAIAVPSFLGARTQAQDTAAKATLRNAYTTAKVYASSNGGKYSAFDAAKGALLEPSLPWTTPATEGGPLIAIKVVDDSKIVLTLVSESGQECSLSDETGQAVVKCGAASPVVVP